MDERVDFIAADLGSHRDELIALNVEYMTWVVDGIDAFFGVDARAMLGASVPEYVARTIDKVVADAPPRGIFYVAKLDGATVAMGGLRQIRPGVGELKRMYVRPGFRGRRLGEALLGRLVDDGKRFGYDSLCLDSAPFMTAAHRLYRAAGFSDCPAYAETEVPPPFHPRWLFMRRAF